MRDLKIGQTRSRRSRTLEGVSSGGGKARVENIVGGERRGRVGDEEKRIVRPLRLSTRDSSNGCGGGLMAFRRRWTWVRDHWLKPVRHHSCARPLDFHTVLRL